MIHKPKKVAVFYGEASTTYSFPSGHPMSGLRGKSFWRLIKEKKLNLSKVQRNVELIVDRCKNKEEVRDFNQYLVNQLEALLPLNIDLNISHLTSQESTGLQAVDLFSWGIFRKYENNKHQIIKSK